MTVFNQIHSECGIILVPNPNSVLLGKIVKQCEINDDYCPCSSIQNEDTKCPCLKARKQGQCCCSMYVHLLND